MKIDPKNDVLWRVYLLYLLMVVFGVLVLVKIVVIQVKEKDELVEKAEKREERFKEVSIYPPPPIVKFFRCLHGENVNESGAERNTPHPAATDAHRSEIQKPETSKNSRQSE